MGDHAVKDGMVNSRTSQIAEMFD